MWQCVALYRVILKFDAFLKNLRRKVGLKSVLQCVAVFYIVSQSVSMCCSVLQCVAMYHVMFSFGAFLKRLRHRVGLKSVLQCVAVRCNVLQCTT